MGCAQIINHEVEWRLTRNDSVLLHQDQVRAATHFIDGHCGPVEYRTHANHAHEPSGFLHAIRVQDNMCHTYRRGPIVLAHFLDARRLN